MMRRSQIAPTGPDRWMISWADLLTLLFASMVVLYASAARNKFAHPAPAPEARVTQAAPVTPTEPEHAAPLATAKAGGDEGLQAAFERLTRSLEEEIAKGQLQISLTGQGITVGLKDRAYFTSGSAEVEPEAVGSIEKIAVVVRELPNRVRLEGHCDSLPIHTQKFRDNWSLSAARGSAVLALLEARFHVPSRRLAIAAYAENQPVSENESEEGRARNRRVDIVILSDSN